MNKKDYLLQLRGISKKFDSFYALSEVDLDIEYGEVHVLLGENGAGKSTLMNIISGLYEPTDGTIYYHGKEHTFDTPQAAKAEGIAMVHQHFMLVEAMTVLENIILCSKTSKGVFLNKEDTAKKISELQQEYGLQVDIHAGISQLSVGEQQKVEIIKALYNDAELFILDEPTAVLTDEEVAGLFSIINQLISKNKSVIFISHKLREVMEISQRVSVLRRGHSVGTVYTNSITEEELADLMVGEKVRTVSYEKLESMETPILKINDVSLHVPRDNKEIKNINLRVRRGEILGIAGVDGNGQSQLVGLITGLLTPDTGECILKGEKVRNYSPINFIRNGIVHIPEDRNKQGLIGEMSIQDNILIKDMHKSAFSVANGAYLLQDCLKEHTERMISKYDIRCSDGNDLAQNLSGGNQQKVILSRELEAEPEIIVAMHPTRGLDIGATNFVHRRLIRARNKGCAVVVVSADLDEVIKVADRIIVMFEGEIMGEVSGKSPNINHISSMMGGNKHESA